jgi:O-antigen/teichoic acid export membrane protein
MHVNNVVWILIGRVIVGAVNFLVIITVAKYLGARDFGLLSYVFSLATIFAAAGNLGLNGLAAREIVKNKDYAQEVLGTVFILRLIGAIGAAVLLMLTTFLLQGENADSLPVAGCASAFMILSSLGIITIWFNANMQAKYISFANILASLPVAMLKLAFIAAGCGLLPFALADVVGAVVSVLFLITRYIYSTAPPLLSWRIDVSRACRMLTEGSFILMGTLSIAVYTQIDQVMLKWMGDPRDVGVYAAAVKLSESWGFIPAAIASTIFPRLVELHETCRERFISTFQRLLDLLFMIAATQALLVTFISKPLVMIVLGSQYQDTAYILMIYIWSMPFIFLRSGLNLWILLERVPTASLTTHGAGAILNILLNLLLIPTLGGRGAAIATVLSYGAASYFLLLVSARTRPVFWMMTDSFLKPWRAEAELRRRIVGALTTRI